MHKAQPVPAFVIAYSDSDFTNPHEMVLPDEPKECTGDFTHMGAKYWGLETARHKATMVNEDGFLEYDHEAHNWVTIGLKERTAVSTITASTKWFTGNQIRAITIILQDDLTGQESEVLTRVTLNPDADHAFDIVPTTATKCHIKLYYEGGLSRVNFFGKATAEQAPNRPNLLETATISHVSNAHYGNPKTAVFGSRSEMYMVGWQSARTGFGERALFTLNRPTIVKEIIVDTYLHRLNSPLTCHVFGLTEVIANQSSLDELMTQIPRWKLIFDNDKEVIPDDFQAYMLAQSYLEEGSTRFQIMLDIVENSPWTPILPFVPLRPDTWHQFTEFVHTGPFTHVLYTYYPNGGIHGLKLFGEEQ